MDISGPVIPHASPLKLQNKSKKCDFLRFIFIQYSLISNPGASKSGSHWATCDPSNNFKWLFQRFIVDSFCFHVYMFSCYLHLGTVSWEKLETEIHSKSCKLHSLTSWQMKIVVFGWFEKEMIKKYSENIDAFCCAQPLKYFWRPCLFWWC